MAELLPSEVKRLVEGRPSGVPPEAIIQHLIDSGHKLLPKGSTPNMVNPEGGTPGLVPENPLETAQNLVSTGATKVGEAAAKLGPMGAIAGVPSFMVAEGAQPQTTLGKWTMGAGTLALGGLGAANKFFKNPKNLETLAETLQATSGINKKSLMDVFQRGKQIFSSPSVEEALGKYVKSIPGLEGAEDNLRKFFGKTVKGVVIPKTELTVDDYKRYLDLTKEELLTGKNDPQASLNAVQSIHKILREMPGGSQASKNAGNVRALIKERENFMGLLKDNFPEFEKANQALRDAHTNESFEHWLPQNKNLSPNVLRTLLAGRNMAAGVGDVISGDIGSAAARGLAAASSSPKMVKAGIQAGQLDRKSVV